jgi:hypothetical protein
MLSALLDRMLFPYKYTAKRKGLGKGSGYPLSSAED